MAITVEPCKSILGAVISGVDLTDPSDTDIKEIYDTLLEHSVVFFRNQMLTDEGQGDFASRFGELDVFPVNRLFKNHKTVTYINDDENSPPKAGNWHTDVTWVEEPPSMAFLQAVEMPEKGGGTMWASLYAAYDALSADVAAFFETLEVEHEVSPVIIKNLNNISPGMGDKVFEAFPAVVHPLVRTHPDTNRKALFWAGGFMKSICGMKTPESDMILNFIKNHIKDSNFHVRWDWEEGDLAIWDERSTNHKGLTFHYPSTRKVRRCTVKGDRPYFDPKAKAEDAEPMIKRPSRELEIMVDE